MAVGCCWVQVQTSATWLFVQRDEFLRFVVVWECSCRRRRLFVCLFVAVVKHCWSYIFFFAIYVFFFMFYSVIVNDQWRQKKIKKASDKCNWQSSVVWGHSIDYSERWWISSSLSLRNIREENPISRQSLIGIHGLRIFGTDLYFCTPSLSQSVQSGSVFSTHRRFTATLHRVEREK